jgi:hypothetical protein
MTRKRAADTIWRANSATSSSVSTLGVLWSIRMNIMIGNVWMINGSDFVTLSTGKEALFSITIHTAEHQRNNSYLARFHRSTSFTINFFFNSMMYDLCVFDWTERYEVWMDGWTDGKKGCLERFLDDFDCRSSSVRFRGFCGRSEWIRQLLQKLHYRGCISMCVVPTTTTTTIEHRFQNRFFFPSFYNSFFFSSAVVVLAM